MPEGPDPERIAARLEQLWTIAQGPGGGADRPAYSASEAAAMRLVAGWAREAELEPAVDAFGNLWALPAGADALLVTSGSHVDTVPDGGRYDGALGTVLGLEVAAQLGAGAGVLICAAEEAPRFGAGTMGSRQMTGALSQEALAQLRDADGITAADARAAYLGELDDLPRIAPPLDRLRAHAEVHVAQRHALRELGVVTAVASPRRFAVRIDGEAGHSGEVSMADRRDALAAAAEVVLAVEDAARAEPAETVATVGTLTVEPGAVSVIPGRTRLAIDVRGIASESLARVQSAIRSAVDEIAVRRGVTAELELVRAGEPVSMDAHLVQAALQAAREHGIPATETWSGAGHDAQHVTALAPALLLFVPLHGGESHTPQEDADMDEIVQAARVVMSVLGSRLAAARS
ncbi:MAG TPA: hydantoinase/carbamoylase family amidase [Solirubrobacteraceae bacterium]|nr:hydantoinase/carbamoylase family amidase [Solirubrobacteraceae bacterium]